MIRLHDGDCLEVLAGMAPESIDACVTDPPYHLLSTVKRFAKTGGADRIHDGDNQYGRLSRGFMGKAWDGGDIAFRPETWAAVLRVLKPGAHLVAFGAPKNYHRLACAIEDAGFEIRDSLMWLFGSGFPKSHDVAKGIDKQAGAELEVVGARRDAYGDADTSETADGRNLWGKPSGKTVILTKGGTTDAAREWQGWGTALKPAHEPILHGTKPVTVRQHFAMVVEELTIHLAEALSWLDCNASGVPESLIGIRAKWSAEASSVLDGARMRSLASIGVAPSAARSSTFSALVSLDLTRTKECSALSHVSLFGSEAAPSGQTIPRGEAGNILTLIMDTCTSVITGGTPQNIASSWQHISGALWSEVNRFTIETAIRLTIALRTLSFSLSQNTTAATGRLTPDATPIILARKPLIGTVAANVLAHGTGAINVDATRVGTEGGTKRAEQAAYPKKEDGTEDRSQHWARTGHGIIDLPLGRWPANIVHDGSDEVLAGFPETKSGLFKAEHADHGKDAGVLGAMTGRQRSGDTYGDSGSAARFFYQAKANAKDRAGSKHPTVKPIALMRWLCRLVTPPGGLILDPFAGSGTTGQAASEEGFSAVLIEREAEYQADIRKRLNLMPADIEEMLA